MAEIAKLLKGRLFPTFSMVRYYMTSHLDSAKKVARRSYATYVFQYVSEEHITRDSIIQIITITIIEIRSTYLA